MAGLVMTLVGCSSESPSAKQCQSAIKEKLINPETAEFFDFNKIGEPEIRKAVTDTIWNGHNVARGDRWRFGNQLDESIEDVVKIMLRDAKELRSYRVKAESKVGLKVTQNWVCSVKSDDCGCIAAE